MAMFIINKDTDNEKKIQASHYREAKDGFFHFHAKDNHRIFSIRTEMVDTIVEDDS